MKKSLLLVIAVAFLATVLTSCSDNTCIVEYPNGQRVEVEEAQAYEVGDTVYVEQVSSKYGTSYIVSKTYWVDTIICETFKDETICWSYTKGVIIE